MEASPGRWDHYAQQAGNREVYVAGSQGQWIWEKQLPIPGVDAYRAALFLQDYLVYTAVGGGIICHVVLPGPVAIKAGGKEKRDPGKSGKTKGSSGPAGRDGCEAAAV